ncbi:MAG: GntR family transcriptional regulator [Polaromonas sp. 39-63-203]|nr:MAG: GntR family transcriptional regulator [Polaromonas sp. 39-63-203]
MAAIPATPQPPAPATAPVSSAHDTSVGATPSFSPLYQQIKGLILQSLQAGEWKPGETIPSEMELAARYRVSQGTVRKAIDEMATDNLVVRRQGRGTFVATHAEHQVQFRFLKLVPDSGTPGSEGPAQRDIIDCRRIVEDLWLPATPFKGLTAERLADYHGPMYALFETEFNVRMVRADEKIRAVPATGGLEVLLKVDRGTPLLSVERIAYTYQDAPMELRRGYYRTDTHHYHNTLG